MLNIGNRRECFFDDAMINTDQTTAEFRLHKPVRRECLITHDAPWEGDGCTYYNFFRDGDLWRMYYIAWHVPHKELGIQVCYAESRDGLHWEKPNLGICEYNGSRNNNIIIDKTLHPRLDNFMVFRDDNPACPPQQRYKGICSYPEGGIYERPGELWYYCSPDGLHFQIGGKITDLGCFDSLNLAFWDERIGRYRCYYRSAHHPGETGILRHFTATDVRDIRMIESEDFVHWSAPKLIDCADAEDCALYTNQIFPYPRAPHIYIGFPTRYTGRPEWNGSYEELCGKEKRRERMALESRFGLAITDGLFMSSRDGLHFKRYDEAFFPPLPENGRNWLYGDGYPARGVIETPSDIPGADPELSILLKEDYWMGGAVKLMRYTIRCDGFVSLHAGGQEKIAVTKPFIYDGSNLYINFSTSGRGYLYLTLTGENGETAESCETFGNSIDRRVWFPNGSVAALAGKPVTLTVRLLDADLYSIQFR